MVRLIIFFVVAQLCCAREKQTDELTNGNKKLWLAIIDDAYDGNGRTHRWLGRHNDTQHTLSFTHISNH